MNTDKILNVVSKHPLLQYWLIYFCIPATAMASGTVIKHPDLDHLITFTLAGLMFNGIFLGMIFLHRRLDKNSLKNHKCAKCSKFDNYGMVMNHVLTGDGWRCEKCIMRELKL